MLRFSVPSSTIQTDDDIYGSLTNAIETRNVIATVGEFRTVLFIDTTTLDVVGKISIRCADNLDILLLGSSVLVYSNWAHPYCINSIDLSTGRRLRLEGHELNARKLCRISDSLVASASKDGTVRIWDLDLRSVTSDNPTAAVSTLSIRDDPLMPSGELFAAGYIQAHNYICGGAFLGMPTPSHPIFFWDLETQVHLGSFEGHEDSLQHLVSNEFRRVLMSSGQDKKCKFWDFRTAPNGTKHSCLDFEAHAMCQTLGILDDEANILVCSLFEGDIQTWDIRNPSQGLLTMKIHTHETTSDVFALTRISPETTEEKAIFLSGCRGNENRSDTTRLVAWNLQGKIFRTSKDADPTKRFILSPQGFCTVGRLAEDQNHEAGSLMRDAEDEVERIEFGEMVLEAGGLSLGCGGCEMRCEIRVQVGQVIGEGGRSLWMWKCWRV